MRWVVVSRDGGSAVVVVIDDGKQGEGGGGSKDGSMETFLVHSAAASLPHMLHATTLRQATRTTPRHAQTCYTRPQLSADMLQLSDMLHATTLRGYATRHNSQRYATRRNCKTYATRHN